MLCAKKKRNDCKLSLGSNHCFSNKPDLSIKHEIIKYFSAPSQKTSECCRGSRRGRAATGGGCGQRVKGGEKYSSSAAGAGSGLVMILCHICWTRLFNQLLHTIQIFLNLQIFLYDLSESGQECEVTHFRKLACTIINGLLGFKLINHLSSHSTLYSLHTNNNIKTPELMLHQFPGCWAAAAAAPSSRLNQFKWAASSCLLPPCPCHLHSYWCSTDSL